ncbi:MAG: Fur family transcriptional regulator [Anaerovoracaceae bacterium]|nr:Fur family transcriptional regulator [Anaerovoracaceae bacterium]
MKVSYERVRTYLKDHNVNPSFNRVKIMEYLIDQKNHPTADQIYKELKKDLPTLSKATIYNSINAFAGAGLVKTIMGEGKEAHYDAVVDPHGHFLCEICQGCFDFDISNERFEFEEIEGFAINEKEVYLRGICKKCLEDN